MVQPRINRIVQTLLKSRNVLLVTHVNPDGDAIGSLIALGLGLKKLKKRCLLYMQDPMPKIYQFLPSQKLIQQTLPEMKFDLTIMIDTGHSDRVGDTFKNFKDRGLTITIDHHSEGSSDADAQFCFPKRAATGEIVYEILRKLRVKMTKAIATNLYTAISTDTGSFKYSNTTTRTFEIASKLVSIGVDVTQVAENAFETFTLARMELLRRALASLTFNENKKIAWIVLRQTDFEETGALAEDTENLINLPRSIDSVEVAAFFKEQPDGQVKVSFRSRVQVDVAKLALTWGGGGHKRAAGCTLEGELSEIIGQVIARIERSMC